MSESLFAPYEPRTEPRSPVDEHRDRFRVEPALPADVPAIARIIRDRDGGTIARHQASLESQLADGGPDDSRRWHILAARDGERDGRVVAYGRSHYFVPPADAPGSPPQSPEGWYLAGLVVEPACRRCGLGHALTRRRLEWLAGRTREVYYFASARNGATIDLHRRLGFVEVTRDFHFPGVEFTGGVGILFRVEV